jgi:RND family efflux transporter MFP subunit
VVSDFEHSFRPISRRVVALSLTSLALAGVMACGKDGGAPAPAAGAPPGGGGVPVDMVTLKEEPIDQIGEYVGTVKSRRSSTIQPQAEGFLTAILAKSGDRVQAGQVLFTIDPGSLRSAIAGLESIHAAREADAAFARQQAERAKKLLSVGAMSQQEYDQAASQQKAAEAQLKAVEEQIKTQQTELAYYRVVAPTAGVVGDIPVHQGDRVTRQTELTTIEDNSGLEVYISVPVQDAPKLKSGLPVQIVSDAGQTLVTERIFFISPSVDDTTQTVLVKTTLEGRGSQFRTDQFVRARIVFGRTPGIRAPIVSLNRINGQYFAFVAEAGPQGGLVAKQRAVQVGPVVGNEYLITGGLKAGDKLITSGIQKIGDNVPVMVLPSAPPGAGREGGQAPEGGKAPEAGKGKGK